MKTWFQERGYDFNGFRNSQQSWVSLFSATNIFAFLFSTLSCTQTCAHFHPQTSLLFFLVFNKVGFLLQKLVSSLQLGDLYSSLSLQCAVFCLHFASSNSFFHHPSSNTQISIESEVLVAYCIIVIQQVGVTHNQVFHIEIV